MPRAELPVKDNAYRFRGGPIDVIAELPEAAARRIREGHDVTVIVEWSEPTDSTNGAAMSESFESAWAGSVKRDAELVERIGDRIGANRTDIANRAYGLAADLRDWAAAIKSRTPRDTQPTDTAGD